MKCLCGSGKFVQNCHGSSITKENFRTLIKTEIFKIVPKQKVWINSSFKSLGFGKQKIRCKIIYSPISTPAGPIIYPLFLEKNNKAIRPVTIDGLGFDTIDGKVTQYIHCMLTPVSWGTISFQPKVFSFGKNGHRNTECLLECEGNPFESVFALETQNGLIKLFHHTSSDNAWLIRKSARLKGSKWNLQGTEELRGNHFIYFTDLEVIQDAFDLIEIGMADKGTDLVLSTDDGKVVETIKVYREETTNRDCTLHIWVDPEIIALAPLILHESNSFSGRNFSWWEILRSSIFRIPIRTNSHFPITHIQDNEYILDVNDNFFPIGGFNAGHGMDMISMKKILSEPIPKLHPRKEALTNADIGELDDYWVKTWEKNFFTLTGQTILDKLKNKKN
jgi:hypothetical protein